MHTKFWIYWKEEIARQKRNKMLRVGIRALAVLMDRYE